jgi:hypothetical protein
MNCLHNVHYGLRIKNFNQLNRAPLLRIGHEASKIFIVAILTILIACSPGWAQTVQKKALPLDKRVSDLEAEVIRLKREVNVYSLDGLPETLML